MSAIDPALLPLKHYADFSGRSTRTELVSFWFLMVVVHLMLVFPAGVLGWQAAQIVSLAFQLAIFCPTAALFVRRLHDAGRSGWWILLGTLSVVLATWGQVRIFIEGPRGAFTEPPSYIDIPISVSGLLLFVMLLWKPAEQANAYGPNPRYDGSVPY